MNAQRFARLQELFAVCCALPPDQQEPHLRSECGSDLALLNEVLAMLAADKAPTSNLDRGPSTADVRAALGRLATDHDDHAPHLPEQIGSYRIIREIASGGMGTVYEAQQETPRRRVALKVMRSGAASRQSRRRFEHESQIMARLRHPGIAQIYESGWTATPHSASCPFFAMEFIPGAAFITDAATRRGLSTNQRIELFATVCDAVHHGHQRGVIHRDLKPSNILVEGAEPPPPATGTPAPDSSPPAPHALSAKVIDFGVARFADDDGPAISMRTEIGQVIGTLQYMSPEQVSGAAADLDARSDVYSLGVVLFELLTGRTPYDVSGTTIAGAARMIAEHEPPRLRTLDKSLRGDIETILAKAMQKDVAHRYQSASELAADLRRYLASEPIHARAPTLVYTLRKAAARNKPATAGALVALLAIIGGAAASVWWAVDASRASDRAERESYRAALGAAGAALREDLVSEAITHLDAAPPHLRGWEWRHYVAQLDQSAMALTLPHPPGTFRDVRFKSYNALVVLTGSIGQPRRVCVWDLRTRSITKSFSFEGRQRAALTHDGAQVLSVDEGGNLVRIDTTTGETVSTARVGASIQAAHLSADGATLLLRAGAITRIESAAAPLPIDMSPAAPGWIEEAVAPDLSATVRLRSAKRDLLRRQPNGTYSLDYLGPIGELNGAAFSPDGRRFVTVGDDGHLRQFETATLAHPQDGFTDIAVGASRLHAVAWSSDGDLIAVATDSGAIRVFDNTGRPVTTLRGHTARVSALNFHITGGSIASVSDDGTVRVWELDDINRATRTIIGRHDGKIEHLALTPDAQRLLTFGSDGDLNSWATRYSSGQLAIRQTMPEGASICDCVALSFSKDGSRLITCASYPAAKSKIGLPFLVSSLDPKTFETIDAYEPLRTDERFSALALSPDGRFILASSFLDLPHPAVKGLVLTRWEKDLSNPIRVPTNAAIEDYPQGACLSISPDSSLALCPAPGNKLLVIETTTWRVIKQLDLPGSMYAAAWRTNPGQTPIVAIASVPGEILFLNPTSWQITASLRGHAGPVTALTFTPDGRRLASGSADATIKLWDPDRAEECATLRGHQGFVNDLEFSPDGDTLYSCSDDGTARAWRATPVTDLPSSPLRGQPAKR